MSYHFRITHMLLKVDLPAVGYLSDEHLYVLTRKCVNDAWNYIHWISRWTRMHWIIYIINKIRENCKPRFVVKIILKFPDGSINQAVPPRVGFMLNKDNKGLNKKTHKYAVLFLVLPSAVLLVAPPYLSHCSKYSHMFI